MVEFSGDDEEIYGRVVTAMQRGDFVALEEARNQVDDFPRGLNGLYEEPWLKTALDCKAPTRVLHWLIDNGSDVNSKDQCDGWPMEQVINTFPFDLEVADLLLRKGADLDQGDCLGYTCLHFAVRQGRDDVVAWLLANGANPFAEQRDLHGKRPYPIHFVDADNHPAIYAMLEEAMAERGI